MLSDIDPIHESARDAVDLIETLAQNDPFGLAILITSALNELRGAVDEGHAAPDLLRNIADHAGELARLIPFKPRQ